MDAFVLQWFERLVYISLMNSMINLHSNTPFWSEIRYLSIRSVFAKNEEYKFIISSSLEKDSKGKEGLQEREEFFYLVRFERKVDEK